MSVALSSLVVSFYEIGIGRGGGGEERGRRVERVGMEVMRGMEGEEKWQKAVGMVILNLIGCRVAV